MKEETKELILDHKQVKQKIKRIAFEIYENNQEESTLVLAGIHEMGYVFAQLLMDDLKIIAPDISCTLVCITLDKTSPLSYGISLDHPLESLEEKVVILVDDVLNSGRAMSYGLKTLLDARTKKIQTAVLVNRSHKRFPISANYKGYELATTINEHVSVNLGDTFSVHLAEV